MKNYYVFTTLLIISLSIAGTGAIAFVAIKPVAAYDNDDDNEDGDNIFRIDHISGIGKAIHFDSLDDCHDYVQHHSQLELSFKDCIVD